MEIIVILGLMGFVGVALWLSQKGGPRNNRGDASTGFYGDTTSAGQVHSDHCGHGHDGGGDCGDCGGDCGGGGGD